VLKTSAALSLLFALLLCAPARADDRWDFGLENGVFIPLKKGQYQHDIPNTKVLEILGNEGLGDENAEGFVTPDLTSRSRVSATLKPMTDVGGHLYYQWSPELQVGLEGGYAVRRSLFIDQRGAFHAKATFLDIQYEGNAVHITPMVKWGRWFKWFRPVVGAGPGWYFFREVLKLKFTDPDDSVAPLVLVDHTLQFTGVAASMGGDFKIGSRGTLGLSLQYNKVFGGSNSLDFILPKASLSVQFGGGDSWF
jgi:hypothetical protein